MALRGFSLFTDSESFPIKKITLLCSAVSILALVPSAFAEQHEFTNTLPNYLEIEQNDTIFLKNLTNSTINLRHTDGLFSSGELYINGTWTGNMPYEVGVYEWVNTNSTGTIVIKSKTIIQEPTVSISGNQLEGNVGSEIKNIPVAVTTISPTFETESVAIKTNDNGNFETTLKLDEVGTHDVIVSYNGKSIGKFSQEVTKEGIREYAGVDILELRLSLLQTLERILEIIYGK
ncbi:hypothetical protein OAI77_05260 [Candidatus Nitrosopelagicus sp.]|nr:hypothetical protein [Candidatus Nitrosopelagicus sp.]